MILGIIGRGYWGDTYAATLRGLGIEHWQAGRDWKEAADGIIIASSADSHFRVAKECLTNGIPIVIEKPMCLTANDADYLSRLADKMDGIVMTGHTHLYSPAWQRFRKQALQEGVRRIESHCGGPCKLPKLWDWGPHDVAMCIDLLGRPVAQKYEGGVLRLSWKNGRTAKIEIHDEPTPRRFVVNGSISYTAPMTEPTPLAVLVAQFVKLIAKGKKDISGLLFGSQVVKVLDGA